MSVEARGDIFQTLTGHFLRGFFRLSFLDDAGEDSFVRAMIGVVVANAILAFAAMTRLYFLKYRELSNEFEKAKWRMTKRAWGLLERLARQAGMDTTDLVDAGVELADADQRLEEFCAEMLSIEAGNRSEGEE